MKVLIACESSGIVRDQFRLLGADAYSCDLLPADTKSEYHIICDVFDILFDSWDLVIAHPPCTYLSISGQHWNHRRPERKILTAEAVNFFLKFTELNCAWAIENPVGIMSTNYRKPDQIIQPYQFGDDASKRTCLWLKDLPPLIHGERVAGRIVCGKERWSNQTDSGQNKLPPSTDRWKIRSKTYPGIAKAMAAQYLNALK